MSPVSTRRTAGPRPPEPRAWGILTGGGKSRATRSSRPLPIRPRACP